MNTIWKHTCVGVSLLCVCSSLFLSSCSNSGVSTPDDTKHLVEYHINKTSSNYHQLNESDLSLYVDYSTCILQGQSSPVYQKILPSLVDKTKHYYSIKGESIKEENLQDSSIYQRLLSVQEVNYAELKKAAEMIANGDCEGVLLTDGEYYNPTNVKANENNPYLANAFKTWMKKGHDIYIISEPYIESYKGMNYNKKRFYMLFTDIRLKNNIYNSILETAELDSYPDVEIFHLSADHPTLLASRASTTTNDNLAANITPYGLMEVQEWNLDWENIEGIIMGAFNEETGEPLKNGEVLIDGLKVDRNSFGGYKIEDIRVEVKDINASYMDFYDYKETSIKSGITYDEIDCPNFIIYDQEEFKRHGIVKLYFDVENLDNSFLVGNPYNYFKIELFIAEIRNVFVRHKDFFVFDALGKPGVKNNSVSSSIEQCLTDIDLQNQMKHSPFYTIYVQSDKK